jgi:hypothetical protein
MIGDEESRIIKPVRMDTIRGSKMSIVMILAAISFIASLVNGIACLLMYLRSHSSIRGVITMIRVDRDGEVKCEDQF